MLTLDRLDARRTNSPHAEDRPPGSQRPTTAARPRQGSAYDRAEPAGRWLWMRRAEPTFSSGIRDAPTTPPTVCASWQHIRPLGQRNFSDAGIEHVHVLRLQTSRSLPPDFASDIRCGRSKLRRPLPVTLDPEACHDGAQVGGVIIHADPPAEYKTYLHRSGRTGRAGAAGTVVTLTTDARRADVLQLTRRAGLLPPPRGSRPDIRCWPNSLLIS